MYLSEQVFLFSVIERMCIYRKSGNNERREYKLSLRTHGGVDKEWKQKNEERTEKEEYTEKKEEERGRESPHKTEMYYCWYYEISLSVLRTCFC